MGADIHMYLEYTTKEELEEYQRGERRDRHGNPAKPYWRNFGSRINPGRNYWMFGFLSKGVRTDFSDGLPAKGLPEFDEMGYYTRIDSVSYISDEATSDNEVTLEKAMKWAQSGCKLHKNSSGKPQWVDHPDWHSHTWLTADEYEYAINKYKEYCESVGEIDNPIEYIALLSAMKTFEENGCATRLIIWFDN
jgi:hypothetical protein